MKRTVYLPDALESRISEYLQQNPQLTFSRLIQESLETTLAPKDLSHLLQLAGIVTEVEPLQPSLSVEDEVVFESRD